MILISYNFNSLYIPITISRLFYRDTDTASGKFNKSPEVYSLPRELIYK